MALSPTVEASQADVAVVSSSGSNAVASQGDVTVVFNIPSEDVQVSQVDIAFAGIPTSNVEISQLDVLAVVRGRPENPNLRSWTFSLDGHDFYVLRLGELFTLVYDTYSEQWMDWQSGDLTFWRPSCGINWIGGEALAATLGSNVVIGDDNFGVLWFLDPTLPLDENPNEGRDPVYFRRITMGQMAIKGREVMPCFALWLTGDMGNPAYTGAGVQLEISDDAGKSFDDCGTVTVTEGVFTPEISWYSLGQIQAPGRLFRISDDGAVARIDGLEMNDPDDDG